MSSPYPIAARWSAIVAPLILFGCFVAGGDEDGDDGGDDSPSGCRSDADCRQGRVCVDVTGNRNDFCEEGEDCACGPPGTAGTGGANGGNGGDSGASTTGGSTAGTGEGGGTTGGNGTGGNSTGGATGGNATGGNTTGGAGAGGSSTGGSSGNCGAYCARVTGAMCTSPTEAACLTECNALSAGCPAEAPAVIECVVNPANPITCMSGSPIITGCDPELIARDRCLICLPATGDGTCATCAKGSCCAEAGDYGVAADGQAFFDCANACTDQACFDGCVEDYPIAGNALLALVECENTECPEECICEAATGDDACEVCYKGSCCAETVEYTLAEGVIDFETCAIECADQPCVDACADQYPEAGAAYTVWAACLDQECLSECSI